MGKSSAIRIPNSRLACDVQCRNSKGQTITLPQGSFIKVINKYWLSKDHPFIEEDYDEKIYAACLTARGMALILRVYIDLED